MVSSPGSEKRVSETRKAHQRRGRAMAQGNAASAKAKRAKTVSWRVWAKSPRTAPSRTKGRRSKKREAAYMGMLRQEIDKLAESLGGTVDWDNPLGPEVFG